MQIPVDFAQVNFRFTGNAAPQGAELTLGIDISGASLDLPTIADNCYEAYSSTLLQMSGNEVALTSVLVKAGPNETGPSAEVTGTDAGSASGSIMPPQVAMLLTKQTAIGGRAGRGRWYVPGIVESHVNSGGVVDPSQLAAWQSEADDFLVAMNASDLVPVVLHGPNSPVTDPTTILSLAVSGKVATQRRRLR